MSRELRRYLKDEYPEGYPLYGLMPDWNSVSKKAIAKFLSIESTRKSWSEAKQCYDADQKVFMRRMCQ